MTVTRDSFLAAIDRVAAAMERDFDMLNTADGALGDGDLGVTMTRGSKRSGWLQTLRSCMSTLRSLTRSHTHTHTHTRPSAAA